MGILIQRKMVGSRETRFEPSVWQSSWSRHFEVGCQTRLCVVLHQEFGEPGIVFLVTPVYREAEMSVRIDPLLRVRRIELRVFCLSAAIGMSYG